MLDKSFTKYARAISDRTERKRVYTLYCALQGLKIAFWISWAAYIITFFYFSPDLSQNSIPDNGFVALWILMIIWVVTSATFLALYIAFRITFIKILQRKPLPDEPQEVTEYKKLMLQKSRFYQKYLWYGIASLVVGSIFLLVCVAIYAFTSSSFANVEWLSYLGIALFATGFFAFVTFLVLHQLKKQNATDQLNQDAAQYTQNIDRLQGRNSDANIQKEKDFMNIMHYLFPDSDLYNKAIAAQTKYNKGILITGIVTAVIDIIAVLLLCTDIVFEFNLYGYACTIFLAILAVGIVIGALIAGKDIKKVEVEQRKRFKDNNQYALTLELYQLYDKYARKQKLIMFSMYLTAFIISALVGVIFPDTYWSLCCLGLLVFALFIISRMTVTLRQKEAVLISKFEQQQDTTATTDNNNSNDSNGENK